MRKRKFDFNAQLGMRLKNGIKCFVSFLGTAPLPSLWSISMHYFLKAHGRAPKICGFSSNVELKMWIAYSFRKTLLFKYMPGRLKGLLNIDFIVKYCFGAWFFFFPLFRRFQHIFCSVCSRYTIAYHIYSKLIKNE